MDECTLCDGELILSMAVNDEQGRYIQYLMCDKCGIEHVQIDNSEPSPILSVSIGVSS